MSEQRQEFFSFPGCGASHISRLEVLMERYGWNGRKTTSANTFDEDKGSCHYLELKNNLKADNIPQNISHVVSGPQPRAATVSEKRIEFIVLKLCSPPLALHLPAHLVQALQLWFARQTQNYRPFTVAWTTNECIWEENEGGFSHTLSEQVETRRK